MATSLYELLQECTVKLTLANGACGTGFFVAPGYVLTCEHVVRGAGETPIQMRWQQVQDFAAAQIERVLPDYDLALLRFDPPRGDLPCVQIDPAVERTDALYLFGYPERDYPDGRPADFVCEGLFTENQLPLVLLKQGQMQPGMSGSALLNCRTGKVCAMAKLSRDGGYADLGGGGIAAAVILEQLPELVALQQAFHQQDNRWQTLLDRLDALPTPPKFCPHNLPRSGTKTFVGRQQDLNRVHAQLTETSRLAITALKGMGGIGKTELALQYGLLHLELGTYPGGICWLLAKEQNIGTEIVNFARIRLNVNPPDGLDLRDQVAYVWSNWPTAGDVLVVIDDVAGPNENEAYAAIKPYLPTDSRFRVLLTTRLQLGASIRTMEITILSEAAALELLESLIGKDRLNQEPDTAKALCHWLGYLPLGLELVGRFLKGKPTWTLAKMQEQLTAKRLEAKALTQAQADMTATHKNLAAAFELSWQDLPPVAQELAYRLSLYALAPIAWEWLEEWYDGTDPDDLEDWRDGELVRRSLLDLDAASNTVQLHQMIREFFRAKLATLPEADALKRQYCQGMVAIAQTIPQDPTRDQILAVTPAIPHIAEAATTWQQWLIEENYGLIRPFVGLGWLYQGQGAYGQAEPWYTDCLAVVRERLGDDHPDVATSLNNLAALYESQGRYSEAEPLYRKALAQRQRLLGDDHLDVATSMNNLASLYRSQGRYSEAEPLYRKALTLCQRLLGDDHPDVAQSMNNLAALYRSQGRYSEAEPLYRDALTLLQRLLGDDHPDVATSMNNLAHLYQSQGRYSEAESLYCEALTLRQRLLGDDHPDVAQSMNNLASLYQSKGRYDEAEPLYRKALTLRQRLLGDDHPDVAQSMNNLAALYESQGRYSEAEPLYRDALTLLQRLLGDDHPDVAGSLNNLAHLYRSEGRYGEAEPLYRDALTLLQRLLGDDHPDVATSLNNLAALYRSQGRYGEAEPLALQALQISMNALGENHPDVGIDLGNLASIQVAQGNFEDAEAMFLQSLSIFVGSVGAEHPYTQETINRLGNFITTVVAAGQTHLLSNHPTTQALLAQIQP